MTNTITTDILMDKDDILKPIQDMFRAEQAQLEVMGQNRSYSEFRRGRVSVLKEIIQLIEVLEEK